eukprot:6173652-Pleurochrysis_carterae.AAC.1
MHLGRVADIQLLFGVCACARGLPRKRASKVDGWVRDRRLHSATQRAFWVRVRIASLDRAPSVRMSLMSR